MNRKYVLIFAITILAITAYNAMAQTNSQTPRYIKVPAGYLMVLRQGDNVLSEIEKLADTEKIPSANFTGMGFVDAKFGFFNFETKQYEPKEFKGVELASMSGTIAWQDGKVSLHTWRCDR